MSWRFLREPKWIARHLAVVVLVVVMILLGLWQLQRLDEKRDHVALVESRQVAAPADVASLVDAAASVDDPEVDSVIFRSATADGRYADDDTVVVENRTLNGAAGAWVLTPLVLDDGTAVIVNRGFIGFDREGAIVPPPAPSGTVRVDGLLLASERRGRFGPQDAAEGALDVLARVDLERYQAQLDYDLLPAYLQMLSSEPPEAAPAAGAPALVSLDPPELSEGPHLGYAVQWFTFTTIAIVGYGLLLRRVARDRAREAAAAEAGSTAAVEVRAAR